MLLKLLDCYLFTDKQDDVNVIKEQDFVEDKAGQLWKRGASYADGYFILENSDTCKVMTAISPSRIEIKGNCKVSGN